ncbi:hypothetical protein [Parapedobacter lycopersici]|uniref:hypothetical protein n=1 Tax=Parapedobacter lycopersici TaxID=1864939 RepID=UPI00214DDE17|nr:hypothetical protein [Parapedobacter lycopersici]
MKRWTDDEKRYISMHRNKSTKKLAEIFGVSENSIKTLRSRLGIKRVKRFPIDSNIKEILKEEKVCVPAKVPVCAPTKVIMVNGRRTEIWGKPSFIQKLEERR